jgi:hypothetical protein
MIIQVRNNLHDPGALSVLYIINSTIKFLTHEDWNFKTDLPGHIGCSWLDWFDHPLSADRMLLGKR